MTFNTKDWQKSQQPIYLLLAVLFLIGICIFYAYVFYQTHLQTSQAQQLELQSLRTKVQRSDAEKKDIDIFLPKYNLLIQQGFIGEERRNDWIETLNDIQKSHQLFEIKYELGTLENFSPPYLTSFSPFSLHKSTMKLNFDALHEGDLLTLTEALEARKLSAWLLKSCELNRENINTPLAHLHAQCEIDWLTLAEPPQTQSAISP